MSVVQKIGFTQNQSKEALTVAIRFLAKCPVFTFDIRLICFLVNKTH